VLCRDEAGWRDIGTDELRSEVLIETEFLNTH